MNDPLARQADTLVSAAQIQAVGALGPLLRRYDFLHKIDTDNWDFVVTIAGVFMAAKRLGELRLDRNREQALMHTITQRLSKWAPDGVVALEDCKRLFEHEYDRLAASDHDPQYVASDAVGTWAIWHVIGRHPSTDRDAALTREVGVAVTLAFFDWWRT